MKVGIVGTGSMGEAHAIGWQASPAQVVGVVARSSDSAEAFAKAHDTRAFSSFDALLDAVDLIDICVPTDLHKSMVLQAAAKGKHVVCEKPIALNLDDARAMIQACDEAGVRLFIAMVVRFFPKYELALKAVHSGQLGDLELIKLRRSGYEPAGSEGWFSDNSRSGGVIVDLMIHDFDYARAIAGEVATVSTKEIPNEDGTSAQVEIEFQYGAKAIIQGDWVKQEGFFETSLTLEGTKASINWESNSNKALEVRTKNTTQNTTEVTRVVQKSESVTLDPYALQLQHVYDAITNDKPFLVTADDALEALRISLAAKASLATGQRIDMKDF